MNRRFKTIGIVCLKGMLVVLGILFLFVGSVFLGVWGKLPSQKSLSELAQNQASQIYDVNRKLIGSFYLSNRQPIVFDSIPERVIEALIATEDARFYDHNGIDIRSLFRVSIKTVLLQDKSSGGGSTISQQLVKNLYKRQHFSLFTIPVAKVKEMLIARRFEAAYTKNELLELYLNTVPFSGNTYGIESASLKFFNKHAKELTTTEAATLIGTLKATHYYNPQRYPERSVSRRNVVLSQMARYGYLSTDSLRLLTKDSLHLEYGTYDEQNGIAPYFREHIRQQLLQWAKKNSTEKQPLNIYTSGLKIYTTLDSKMQLLAEAAIKTHMNSLQRQFEKEYGNNTPWSLNSELFKEALKKLKSYKKLKDRQLSEAAIFDSLSKEHTKGMGSTIDSLQHYLKLLNTGMIAIDPKDGAIRSWIGGRNFERVKYDHVTSKRQVGSTFKPLLYAAAIEKGMYPCDYISADEVAYVNLENWSPSNSNDEEEPYINYSMEGALTKSINTVSVKILERTGIENLLGFAKKLHIESEIPAVPSIALGTAELSIKELAGAYASFVNESRPVAPYSITRVENSQGQLLEAFQPEIYEPAYSKRTRQSVLEMMQSVVNDGTAQRLRSTHGLKMDIAGKTGTTQNNKDAWFVGVTPHLVTVSWVGHDDYRIGFKTTRIGQGANAALPNIGILLNQMSADSYFNRITKAKFEEPTKQVLWDLNCPPTKRDGFFKRLFKNPNKKKKSVFDNLDD